MLAVWLALGALDARAVSGGRRSGSRGSSLPANRASLSSLALSSAGGRRVLFSSHAAAPLVERTAGRFHGVRGGVGGPWGSELLVDADVAAHSRGS